MKMSRQEFMELLPLLGLSDEDFANVRQADTVEEGQEKLVQLKAKAKAGFKKAALELHPDRTGNDPEKTEKFKLVALVLEYIEQLKVMMKPQPQQFIHVQFGFGVSWVSNDGSQGTFYTETTATRSGTSDW